MKTKEPLRKKSRILRITTKNGEQVIDQKNGLGAKISKEEIRSTMDLQEIFPHLIKISLQGPTSHVRTITRTTEEYVISVQISRSIETMEIDLEVDLSTTRIKTGETTEFFPVLHRLRGEIYPKTISIANQVISLTTMLSAELTIDLRPLLRPKNESFRKTKIKHHLMWFASPQPTILLTNCWIFAR